MFSKFFKVSVLLSVVFNICACAQKDDQTENEKKRRENIPRNIRDVNVRMPSKKSAHAENIIAIVKDNDNTFALNVAVQKFKLRFKKMPSSLEELCEKNFINKVPADPWKQGRKYQLVAETDNADFVKPLGMPKSPAKK